MPELKHDKDCVSPDSKMYYRVCICALKERKEIQELEGRVVNLMSMFQGITHRTDKVINEQKFQIVRLQNVEEKVIAMIGYMRKEQTEAVMACIAEMGFLYPPKEKDGN